MTKTNPNNKESSMTTQNVTATTDPLDEWVKPYTEAWLRGDLMAIRRLSSAWLMDPAEAYSHILAMALQMGRITKAQHDRCVSRSLDLLIYINQ
jgi:hypothetical protein